MGRMDRADLHLGFEYKAFLTLRPANVATKERKGRVGGKIIILCNVGQVGVNRIRGYRSGKEHLIRVIGYRNGAS